MPANRMPYETRRFDPEGVAVLVDVFERIVAQLDLRTPAEKETAAKHVVQLAHSQTQLDASKLRESVLAAMRH